MTCNHGWTEPDLRARLAEAEAVLLECEQTTHPMRDGMITGQRRIVDNLRGHLAEIAAAPAPDLAATPDREYGARIDAERVTLQFGQKSTRRLDAGRKSILDSPLFGGDRQEEMF